MKIEPIIDPEPECLCGYCTHKMSEWLSPRLKKTAEEGYKRPRKTTIFNILTKQFGEDKMPCASSGVARWLSMCEPLWTELWDEDGRPR
jgi:hypothetical protein